HGRSNGRRICRPQNRSARPPFAYLRLPGDCRCNARAAAPFAAAGVWNSLALPGCVLERRAARPAASLAAELYGRGCFLAGGAGRLVRAQTPRENGGRICVSRAVFADARRFA